MLTESPQRPSWRSTPPTEPGVYVWCENLFFKVFALRRYHDGELVFEPPVPGAAAVRDTAGDWFGPLPMPPGPIWPNDGQPSVPRTDLLPDHSPFVGPPSNDSPDLVAIVIREGRPMSPAVRHVLEQVLGGHHT